MQELYPIYFRVEKKDGMIRGTDREVAEGGEEGEVRLMEYEEHDGRRIISRIVYAGSALGVKPDFVEEKRLLHVADAATISPGFSFDQYPLPDQFPIDMECDEEVRYVISDGEIKKVIDSRALEHIASIEQAGPVQIPRFGSRGWQLAAGVAVAILLACLAWMTVKRQTNQR